MAERARENERKETGNLKALVIVSQHWARGDGQRDGARDVFSVRSRCP